MITLDTLPTELLVYILSLIDPPTSTLTIPPRSSLYRCCLVSRRMRDCAQPLLWRALHSKNLDALAREAGADGPGRHARIFELDGMVCFEQHGRVKRLLQLPGLVDVRISGWTMGARHQDLFNLLAPLRRLVLHEVCAVKPLNPVVFPNLQALTLRDCYLPPLFLSTFLRPHCTPRLRHLHISQVFDYEPDIGRYFPALDGTVLRRLETLQVDISDLQLMDSGPETHEVHVLASVSIRDLSGMVALPPYSPFPLRHLHVPSFLSDPYLASQPNLSRLIISNALAALADFLPSSSLSTILLPTDLKDPEWARQHGAIRKACDEKRIEILWAEDTVADKSGRWMREELNRWVARKKREGEQAR
ncbi:hypothetical protein JCM6882_004963 [Rhodosporidiobolus microsporus]